jgi:chemosensory pili system protein ChpA (sensor histidine kinase/response regulator)
VLGNGQVALIINPAPLVQRMTMQLPAASVAALATPVAEVVAPTIMVVDDSLTVRKITTRLLSKEGYQVVTAKDGVDALQHLQEILPDVMLVDIEMPRMDGFELTKNVRSDPKTAHIPIIMITSRTAEKHRNYAMELGVNAYLGKPFQEDELLGHIAGFIKKTA